MPGVPDVDGDGAIDVGRIRTGQYLAVGRGNTRLVGGLAAYDVVTFSGRDGKLGVRDTNHDGVFDAEESERSLSRSDGLTAAASTTAPRRARGRGLWGPRPRR